LYVSIPIYKCRIIKFPFSFTHTSSKWILLEWRKELFIEFFSYIYSIQMYHTKEMEVKICTTNIWSQKELTWIFLLYEVLQSPPSLVWKRNIVWWMQSKYLNQENRTLFLDSVGLYNYIFTTKKTCWSFTTSNTNGNFVCFLISDTGVSVWTHLKDNVSIKP